MTLAEIEKLTDWDARVMVAEILGWVRHPQDKWVVTAPGYPHSVQPLNTIPNYPRLTA